MSTSHHLMMVERKWHVPKINYDKKILKIILKNVTGTYLDDVHSLSHALLSFGKNQFLYRRKSFEKKKSKREPKFSYKKILIFLPT